MNPGDSLHPQQAQTSRDDRNPFRNMALARAAPEIQLIPPTSPDQGRTRFASVQESHLFQDASGVTLEGYNTLTSAGGNIYNISPSLSFSVHPDATQAVGSGSSLVEAHPTPRYDSAPGSQFGEGEHHSEVYARLLLPKRLGWPLWLPKPMENLPEVYRKKGISIGDVGIITEDGQFDFFFNIRLPASDPINRNRVPEYFEPINHPADPEDVWVDSQAWMPGDYVITRSIAEASSIRSIDSDPTTVPEPSQYQFSASAPAGAVVLVPDGGFRQNLLNTAPYIAYSKKHGKNWYKHINQDRGRGAANGSVYLITGIDKAQVWGTGVYSQLPPGSNLHPLTFRKAALDSNFKYVWNRSHYATTRYGPLKQYFDGSTDLPHNQCIFLRGFRVALSEGLWSVLTRSIEVSPIQESSPESLLQKSREVPFGGTESSFFGSYLGGRIGSATTRAASSSQQSDEDNLHPADILNRHLLRQHTTADVAITHDDVWCSVLDEDSDVLPSPSELLARIEQKFEIIYSEGGVSFAPRESENPDSSQSMESTPLHQSVFRPPDASDANSLADVGSVLSEDTEDGQDYYAADLPNASYSGHPRISTNSILSDTQSDIDSLSDRRTLWSYFTDDRASTIDTTLEPLDEEAPFDKQSTSTAPSNTEGRVPRLEMSKRAVASLAKRLLQRRTLGSPGPALSDSSQVGTKGKGSQRVTPLAEDSARAVTSEAFGSLPQSSDDDNFLVPVVTRRGQFGDQRWQMPQSTGVRVFDNAPIQGSRPSQPNIAMKHGPDRIYEPINDSLALAGFGIPKRSGTPEPWTRKLSDDGISYYYYNKHDGRTQMGRPGAYEGASSATEDNLGNSIDSGGISRPQPEYLQPSEARDGQPGGGNLEGQKTDYAHAVHAANLFQHLLLPPQPPTTLEGLLVSTRTAIHAIIETIGVDTSGLSAQEDNHNRIDGLVNDVTVAVRNLLCVSISTTARIPSDGLSAGEILNRSAPPTPAPPTPTKVAATLSKLLLSCHMIQCHYNSSGTSVTDDLQRVGRDAEELEEVLQSFISNTQQYQAADNRPPTRLHGSFSPANLGIGLPGAGVAGGWSGFGWVAPDDSAQRMSRKELDENTMSEFKIKLSMLTDHFELLDKYLDTPDGRSGNQVQRNGRQIVTHLAALMDSVSDICVARHVDIDGFRQEGTSISKAYEQTVETARILVRTLEATVQTTYDDTAAFLMAIQRVSDSPRQQQRSLYDLLHELSSALTSDSSLVLQTLETLLSVGRKQAEIDERHYNASIESQMAWVRARPPSEFNSNSNNPSPIVARTSDTISPERAAEPSANRRATRRPLRLASEEREATSTIDGQHRRSWLLQPDYDPSEILLGPDNSVRGGTLSALVERLTAQDQTDREFVNTFLTTFKSFTTVDELFDLLVSRFRIQPPSNLEASELKDWSRLKQQVIQMRVINILESLVTDNDTLEKEDFHIFSRIEAFARSDEASHLSAAMRLQLHIERARTSQSVKKIPIRPPPPAPILPKANKKLRLTDVDAIELSRQLTILESGLYSKFSHVECLQRIRGRKAEKSDNIEAIVRTSARISNWVVLTVLGNEDIRKRAATIKEFITVADRCRALNNFSSAIAIASGLNAPSIRRLKRTWELVSQRTAARLAACELVIDSNKTFTGYKQLTASVTPPCVPFIGVFLSTLQNLQDDNPDVLPGGLINFRKRQKMSEIISDIKRWQTVPFNLQSVASIQQYIEESLGQFNNTKASSDHFWALSLEREPREREEEKMARLLQESGFL